ncbi:MAG: Lrp/AsnC family transcriptional regulator [Labrys sp. (in: a-proteobacteria)]|jgi:DNA-binding Lrp family transcriptional regulator
MIAQDEIDAALIARLRLNARESIAALARHLGLSRSTVQDRLRRLETGGVIAGYDVRLAVETRPGVRATIMLAIDLRLQGGIINAVRGMPEVEQLHTIAGKFDLLAVVACPTTEALDRVLDRIAELDGVRQSESAVILSTKLDRR